MSIGKALGNRNHTTILYSRNTVAEIKQVNDRIAKETGFELENHDIVFHGLCPHCRQPKSEQQKKGA